MALLFFTVNIIAAFIAMASVTQLETSHYLWGGETMTAGGTFLARFGTYAILMSNMIPISLLVTMDMVKFLSDNIFRTRSSTKFTFGVIGSFSFFFWFRWYCYKKLNTTRGNNTIRGDGYVVYAKSGDGCMCQEW